MLKLNFLVFNYRKSIDSIPKKTVKQNMDKVLFFNLIEPNLKATIHDLRKQISKQGNNE